MSLRFGSRAGKEELRLIQACAQGDLDTIQELLGKHGRLFKRFLNVNALDSVRFGAARVSLL
jgi:hypothetical protein